MPQFSANLSMLYTEYPLYERIKHAANAGFEAVEIQFPYEANPQILKKALEESRMPLNLINIPAGDLMCGGNGLACIPTKEHEFKRAVQNTLAWAKELNVPQVNLLAGKQPKNCDLLACLNTFTNNARYAADVFAEHNIRLLIEAINPIDVPNFLIATMEQQLEILTAINHSNIFIQFDIYHMAKNGDDVLQLLTEHIALIKHIQFADTPKRHEPKTRNQLKQHSEQDSTHLDFATIFNLVDDLGYTGYMAAEYQPSSTTADSLAWLTSISK